MDSFNPFLTLNIPYPTLPTLPYPTLPLPYPTLPYPTLPQPYPTLPYPTYEKKKLVFANVW